MTSFDAHHGARRTINQVRADLRRLGLRPSCRVIRSCKLSDALGHYSEDTNTVCVRDDIRGAALYRVVLHEFGHALGLDHRHTKCVMAPMRCTRSDFQETEPTLAQRKRWAFEIAQAVLELKRKHWEAA